MINHDLPPGIRTVINRTGRMEWVLNEREFQSLVRDRHQPPEGPTRPERGSA